MSTALYVRTIDFNYEDDERAALMRKVWAGTPWMVDAYTGRYDDGREREMLEWCYVEFGPQAFPIHGKPGRWQRGCASIFGWTWFGFAEQADMEKFQARWPAPVGVEL